MQQLRCAKLLLTTFLKQLENPDRFKDALVIVHSHHGNYLHPPSRNSPFRGILEPYGRNDRARNVQRMKTDSSAWDTVNIELRSSALMLIKLPHSEKFSISHARIQTIEIPLTNFNHFGTSTKAYRGKPIQLIGEDIDRAILFYAHNSSPKRGTRPEWVSEYQKRNGVWKFVRKIGVKP